MILLRSYFQKPCRAGDCTPAPPSSTPLMCGEKEMGKKVGRKQKRTGESHSEGESVVDPIEKAKER